MACTRDHGRWWRGNGLRGAPEKRAGKRTQIRRLRKRISEMIALDFFGANGREPAESLLLALEEHMHEAEVASPQPETKPAFIGKGRIWVTRRELHGD